MKFKVEYRIKNRVFHISDLLVYRVAELLPGDPRGGGVACANANAVASLSNFLFREISACST
eukprot:SAG22_NODE_348_length_11873_cov_4.151435_7_plen_62_part_00